MTRLAVTAHALHLPGPDDDPRQLLGRKGLLGKDQATRLALCAVHRALGREPAAPRPAGPPAPDVAVVVASNLGNVGTVGRIARELRTDGVRAVSPMDAPNASSNVTAGAIAIWFRYGGPNLTVCSGATAGLDAIGLAGLLLRARRAREVVVVGVEPDDKDAARVNAARSVETAELRAAAACLILSTTATAPQAWISFTQVVGAEAVEAPVAEMYGAAGVVETVLAVGAHEHRHVVCGDAADGRRELWVSPA